MATSGPTSQRLTSQTSRYDQVRTEYTQNFFASAQNFPTNVTYWSKYDRILCESEVESVRKGHRASTAWMNGAHGWREEYQTHTIDRDVRTLPWNSHYEWTWHFEHALYQLTVDANCQRPTPNTEHTFSDMFRGLLLWLKSSLFCLGWCWLKLEGAKRPRNTKPCRRIEGKLQTMKIIMFSSLFQHSRTNFRIRIHIIRRLCKLLWNW